MSDHYQKINTIYKRDKYNVIMPYDELVMPELEWMRNCKFECTEKIDGTNTRIIVKANIVYMPYTADNFEIDYDDTSWPLYVDWSVEYKGKNDKSSLPKPLEEYLKNTYPAEKVLAALGLSNRTYLSQYIIDKVDKIHWQHATHQDAIDHKWVKFDEKGNPTTELDTNRIPHKYTLYGEGFGNKIQKVGDKYIKDGNSFIGFDIQVNEEYLLHESMESIFKKLDCPIVPFIGNFTIDEAIEYVKKGFKSTISEDNDLMAEGLVCKNPLNIKNRRGERIMFKVKTCDWNKYYAKYGTYDKVEQEPNEHY